MLLTADNLPLANWGDVRLAGMVTARSVQVLSA